MRTSRDSDEDYEPVAWLGQIPVYATTLLVALHVAAMVGTAVAMALTGAPSATISPWLSPLLFSNEAVLHSFQIWRLVTYVFVNEPSLWFAVEMWMLFMFGREVERFLGRRAFLWLYAALVLAAPVALTALGVLKVPAVLAGGSAVHFAVFLAFVMLHPRAEFFFGLQARWVAVIFLAIYSLQYLAYQAWIPFGVLWLECGCAALMLKFAGVSSGVFAMQWPRAEAPEPRGRTPAPKAPAETSSPEDVHDSIDPLLEKISRSGIGSLTRRERDQLERARVALLEREKNPH